MKVSQGLNDIIAKEERSIVITKNKEEIQLRRVYRSVLKQAQGDPELLKFLQKVHEQNAPTDDESIGTLTTLQIDFEKFKKFYQKFTNEHRKCGHDCIHLQRFYERIGFDIFWNKRRRLDLKKQVINPEITIDPNKEPLFYVQFTPTPIKKTFN